MAASTRTLLVALALAACSSDSLAAAPGQAGAAPEAILADDECAAGRDDGECALSAAQLRAQQIKPHKVEEAAAEAKPVAAVATTSPRNASLLEGPTYSAKCFAYTGGTCVTEQCNPSRKAECLDSKCVCSGCAGADGACHTETNKLVAKGFHLNNGKFSKYKMYFQRVSTFGQMSTTKMWSSFNMEQDVFDLYEVPGQTEDGAKEYFLASSKWPDYVVGFKATTGTALSPFAAYAVDLSKKASLLDAWGPSSFMLRVCSLGPKSSYEGGIQIGAGMGPGDSTIWAYLHHGSWYVYGSMTSPGAGGIWIPDPPLPASVQLPLCE